MGEVREMSDPFEEIMDIFLEMKDTSELMVDLSYSALLYNSKEIAREVEHLGDEVSELSSRLQKIAIEEMSCGSSDATLMALHLCNYVNSIARAALSISEVVTREIEPHPILKESIREGDIGIFRREVDTGSVLDGVSLGAARLASETGMWVIAIRRGRRWIYGPERDQVIKGGDILFFRGPHDGAKKLKKMVRNRKRSAM
ncbi:MAG: TrkA C-terminal domain-containing protein [Candidatus Thermoplasmatota archaeon]|nr:TrkA C-terminal domain-containing protein [Candidatus Thermoplasmatota archaeon]